MAGKALTENGALSNDSTGSARLNLFFKAVRSLGKDVPQLHQLLSASWNEDPLDTLKIIYQSRDCRGGKGEKKLFAESLLWLSAQHPQTLGKNIKYIPEFGMWKDLLALVPTPFVDDVLKMFANQLRDDLNKVQAFQNKQKEKKEKAEAAQQEAKEEKKEGEEIASESKEVKNKKERPPLPHISLAAKWAPTEKHGDDKKTGSALKLALLLSEDPKTALRDYRKKYLTPLRAHLKIIETYTCAKKWDEIPYTLVPSRCMNLHKKEFQKHDSDRFTAYLEDVKAGKSTIKGKQMMPHELVEQSLKLGSPDDVAELQWKVLAEETRKLGSLSSSLVVSDVSGSMSGTPMMVSIALGLLISEVTAPPFKDCVITFHENPTFHVVQGDTLHARAKHLQAAPWGGSTNFQGVFNLILDKAVANKVPAADMPKKLFVISDMQFDSADSNFATNFQTIKHRYANSGYAMPQIIFWNVRSSPNEFPVTKDEIGVAMLSGFSPSLLKSILKAADFATPWEVLREILDGPRYKVLQV